MELAAGGVARLARRVSARKAARVYAALLLLMAVMLGTQRIVSPRALGGDSGSTRPSNQPRAQRCSATRVGRAVASACKSGTVSVLGTGR